MKTNGLAIHFESLINGAPLVVIALESAANRKTGSMIQTYILRDDIPPIEAAKTGADVSICGSCIHRPVFAKQSGEARCYVNLGHGPRVVWEAYKRGRYDITSPRTLRRYATGKALRLGTYGDPGGVDASFWTESVKDARTWTGYTHRWRDTGAGLRDICMASVDSEAERDEAQALGWRTFRVMRKPGPRAKGEAQCPASKEAGKRTTCAVCPIGCRGASGLYSVAIVDHGPGGAGRKRG